jgi:hypothetical protein
MGIFRGHNTNILTDGIANSLHKKKIFYASISIVIALIWIGMLPLCAGDMKWGTDRFFEFAVKDESGSNISHAQIDLTCKVEGVLHRGYVDVKMYDNTYIIEFNHHPMAPVYCKYLRHLLRKEEPESFSFSFEKKGYVTILREFTLAELDRKFLMENWENSLLYRHPHYKYLRSIEESPLVYRLPDFVIKEVDSQ